MTAPFIIVNHIDIRPDADWAELSARLDAMMAQLKTYSGVRAEAMFRGEGDEAILVAVYDDEATGKRLSSEVAGPWFAQHIRPFLAGPARRSAGPAMVHIGF